MNDLHDSPKNAVTEDLGFPVGIFPQRLRDIISDIHDDMNYPIDYLCGSILFTVSVLIGATKQLICRLGKVFANLFLVLLGPQGNLKTHPLTWATYFLIDKDLEELSNYKKQLKEYKLGVAKGEAVEKPVCRRMLINDTTPEAIGLRLMQNPCGIGLYQGEITRVFDDVSRYNPSSSQDLFLTLFDGSPLINDRATKDEVLAVKRPFFSMAGTTQPTRFLRYFSGERYDSGLFARFLVIPHHDYSENLWKIDEDIPSDAKERLIQKLNELYENRGISYDYVFDTTAWEHICTWQNEHESNLVSQGRSFEIEIFRKTQIYALKFSLLLQIIWDLFKKEDNVNDNHIVTFQTAVFATILADYFFTNSCDLANAFVGNTKLSIPEQKLFDALPDCFLAKEGEDIAAKHQLGRTSFYTFIRKCRGILIEQVKRGVYRKKYPSVRKNSWGVDNKSSPLAN